jgi:hypothetical protein
MKSEGNNIITTAQKYCGGNFLFLEPQFSENSLFEYITET